MKRQTKILIFCIITVLIVILLFAGKHYYEIIDIGLGYKAKNLCSGVFVSKRSEKEVLENDFNATILDYINCLVDYEKQSVTASIFGGIFNRTAYYHGRFGAVLDLEVMPAGYDSSQEDYDTGDNNDADLLSHQSLKGIDCVTLTKIIDSEFIEKDDSKSVQTRGVVVLYNGKIVAEKYSENIIQAMPLCGWSMSKSVLNALAGRMAALEMIQMNIPMNLSYWTDDTEKRKIILDDMLRMRSGLEFEESYKNYNSDVFMMLYKEHNAAEYAASKPLIYKPGTKWSYSSGTTNIIAKFLDEILNGRRSTMRNFIFTELFNKLGMRSASAEIDASGNLLLSTGIYASARDWARLGKLYLQKGKWNGERLLPEWWIEYTIRHTENSRYQKFGAHFWLKPKDAKNPDDLKIINRLPDDLFYAAGHYGQFLFIVPSKDLVVVRLAQTYYSDLWNEFEFLEKVINTIE